MSLSSYSDISNIHICIYPWTAGWSDTSQKLYSTSLDYELSPDKCSSRSDLSD